MSSRRLQLLLGCFYKRQSDLGAKNLGVRASFSQASGGTSLPFDIVSGAR